MATKSDLISGMGVAMSFIQGVVASVRELGGTDEQIHELVTEQGKTKLMDIAHLIVGAVKDILLQKVASVAVSANKKFVVSGAASANVGWMSNRFKELFGNKVEQDVPATQLAVHRLEKASLDAPILTELGEKAKTKLAYLFELMQKQNQGQEGVLLVNGYANIVYVADDQDILWAVDAHWGSFYRDWHVNAYSVESPRPWDAGRQILSCDS